MRILNFCLIALNYLSHKEIEFYQYGLSFCQKYSVKLCTCPRQHENVIRVFYNETA